MTINKAKVLAFSENSVGEKIITYYIETNVATFLQMGTHRSFTKNAVSKRAVKILQQIEAVRANPFLYTHYWKDQKVGMQPTEEYKDMYQDILAEMFQAHLDEVLKFCKKVADLELSRQQVANYMMPFQVMKGIWTCPQYGLENFFDLRCDKKKGAQHEISELACIMRDLYENTTPVKLKYGEWHIPFHTPGLTLQENIEKSVACTAHASYDNIDESRPQHKYKDLHDRLEKMKHESCFQHICMSMGDHEHYEAFRGFASLRETKKLKGRKTKAGKAMTVNQALTNEKPLVVAQVKNILEMKYKLRNLPNLLDNHYQELYPRQLIEETLKLVKE